MWDGCEESSELCAAISEDYNVEISQCTDINYVNWEQFKVEIFDYVRMKRK